METADESSFNRRNQQLVISSSLSAPQVPLYRNRLVWLCFAPFAFIALMIAVFGVDVLYWDEWMMWIKLLGPLQDGSLSLQHLVAQQNEQRNAAARVFGLLLLPVFKLNRFAELYLIMGLVAVSFAALLRLYDNTRNKYGIRNQQWAAVAMAFLLFALPQWELYTVGVNTAIALPITCLCLSLALLGDRTLPAWKFALLCVIGYIGSFNFANGLFNWFCLIPSLLITELRPGRKKLVVALWLLVSASAWLLYFTNYSKPPHHPSLLYIFEHPLVTVGFLLAYIGATFSDQCIPFPAAIFFGAGGVALLLHTLWRLRRAPLEKLQGLAPWLALLFFACLTAGATCVGRAGFGIQRQALQSRYIAFSCLFWISLAVLTACADRLAPISNARFLKVRRWFFYLCCAGYLITTAHDVIVIKHRAEKFIPARAELFRLQDDNELRDIFPDPNFLKSKLHGFFQARLGSFRDFKQELREYKLIDVADAGALESVRVIPGEGEQAAGVLLVGWARDPRAGKPARYVLLVNKGKLFYAAVTGEERQPLAQSTGKPWLRSAGFSIFLPSSFFAEPEASFEAYSLSADGNTIARLAGPSNPEDARVAAPPEYFPPFIIRKHFYSQ
jgi:hypothetical protein